LREAIGEQKNGREAETEHTKCHPKKIVFKGEPTHDRKFFGCEKSNTV